MATSGSISYLDCSPSPSLGLPPIPPSGNLPVNNNSDGTGNIDGHGNGNGNGRDNVNRDGDGDDDDADGVDQGGADQGVYMDTARPSNLKDLVYTKQRKHLHRAFFLCGIPDERHVTIMMIGGITDIEDFAITNQREWKEQAIPLSKYKQAPVHLDPHMQQRLSALSLWA